MWLACAWKFGLRNWEILERIWNFKWYYKLNHKNDERSPVKLLLNEWKILRVKVAPENFGLPMLMLWRKNSISKTKYRAKTKQRLFRYRRIWGIWNGLKTKIELHIYKEMKCGVWFREYLIRLKGPFSRFFRFYLGTHGLFEEVGTHAMGIG